MNALFVNPKARDDALLAENLLVFFHAQRTGGSALRHILARALGQEAIYCTQFVDKFQHWPKLTPADLQGYAVFAGHSNFEPKEMVRSQRFVTLMRHPVYRTISIYYYAKRYETQFLHPFTLENGLVDFYYKARKEHPGYFANVMCQRICGRRKFDLARDNLEANYWAVGATEKLGVFVDWLLEALSVPSEKTKDLGWDKDKYAKELQHTDMVNDILKDNLHDVALFEYMNEKYFGLPDEHYPKLT